MNILIREIPDELRPREKLLNLGPSALSQAELLALFLRTGIRGRSAIQLSQDLIDQYGSLHKLGAISPAELSKRLGIGPAKACQIAAAFELGVRCAREQMMTTPLITPRQIHSFMAPQISHLRQEVVHVICLDTKLRLISTQQISQGTVNQTICHPRDVLGPTLAQKAYAFILVHNHPSGDPSPSEADHEITNALCEASDLLKIRFQDHLIIGTEATGRQAYYSFSEMGYIDS